MRLITTLCVLASLTMLAGCKSYQLRGTVVDGLDPAIGIRTPGVYVVSPDDPRLSAAGIPGASVKVMLDPHTPRPKTGGQTTSGPTGQFAMTIGHGAGVMLYDAHVLARRSGQQTAETVLPLPRGNQRLLIVLPRGRDTWQPKVDFVDETMEMGRPYLEGGR